MPTFHYYPPSSSEQREFIMQLIGTVLGLLLLALICLFKHEPAVRATALGVAVGVIWLLAQTAWRLEKKAQRSQHAAIGYDEEGLRITDDRGHEQLVAWDAISEIGMSGGRLSIVWPGSSLKVGTREIENGMELVRGLMQHREGRSTNGSAPPSNFIPLDPR